MSWMKTFQPILRTTNLRQKIALVSDAGTPLFCDPGAVIVKELRKNGISVTSLSGANALATFLSQVSRNGEDFHFYGFLPKSNTQLEELFKKGFKAKEIASILSELDDLNKNDVYKRVLEIND